jgi:hypothetical protein
MTASQMDDLLSIVDAALYPVEENLSDRLKLSLRSRLRMSANPGCLAPGAWMKSCKLLRSAQMASS